MSKLEIFLQTREISSKLRYFFDNIKIWFMHHLFLSWLFLLILQWECRLVKRRFDFTSLPSRYWPHLFWEVLSAPYRLFLLILCKIDLVLNFTLFLCWWKLWWRGLLFDQAQFVFGHQSLGIGVIMSSLATSSITISNFFMFSLYD